MIRNLLLLLVAVMAVLMASDLSSAQVATSRAAVPAVSQSRAPAATPSPTPSSSALLFRPGFTPDFYLAKLLRRNKIPGGSIVIIRNNRITTSIHQGRKVSISGGSARNRVNKDTMFLVGGPAKAVTYATFLRARRSPLVSLDRPVNSILGSEVGFNITNPIFAETPITFRHILSQTSTIRDRWDAINLTYTNGGDSPIALVDYFRSIFGVNGTFNDPRQIYFEDFPGLTVRESKFGAGLSALFVNLLTGQDFDSYSTETILQPLQMTNTYWRLRNIPEASSTQGDLTDMAQSHVFNPVTRTNEVLPLYGWANYPDGQLYSSAENLARFVQMFIDNGAGILTATEVQTMLQPFQDDQMLGWYFPFNNTQVIGMYGMERGSTSFIGFDPESRNGIVLLFNGRFRKLKRLLSSARGLWVNALFPLVERL